MGHGDHYIEYIDKSVLQEEFPGMWTASIASPAVDQDADFFDVWILKLTHLPPPPYKIVHGELWRIMGTSDEKGTLIGMNVIDPIGTGSAYGQGGKVMIID